VPVVISQNLRIFLFALSPFQFLFVFAQILIFPKGAPTSSRSGFFVLPHALDPSAIAGWVLVHALSFPCLLPEVSRLWIHAAGFEPLFLASILPTPGRAPVSSLYFPLTRSGARVLCLVLALARERRNRLCSFSSDY
jgi:hypothetical protein